MPKFLVALFLTTIAACSTPGSKADLPQLSKALGLRGSHRDKVIKTLGEPADNPNPSRAFWFLSDESAYHPDPTPTLYEFRFNEKGILESVKKGVQAE
jgi:hypothetical protein